MIECEVKFVNNIETTVLKGVDAILKNSCSKNEEVDMEEPSFLTTSKNELSKVKDGRRISLLILSVSKRIT